jgi:hypothetical protein
VRTALALASAALAAVEPDDWPAEMALLLEAEAELLLAEMELALAEAELVRRLGADVHAAPCPAPGIAGCHVTRPATNPRFPTNQLLTAAND